jgi:hypothetical protein
MIMNFKKKEIVISNCYSLGVGAKKFFMGPKIANL